MQSKDSSRKPAQRRTKRSVALAYAHVATNLGDLAINEGIKAIMAQIDGHKLTHALMLKPDRSLRGEVVSTFGKVKTTAFAVPPTKPAQGNSAAELMRLTQYLADPSLWWDDAQLGKVDAMILNAGEHFFEDPQATNIAALAWRALPVLASRERGISTVIAPSTWGPISSPYGDTMLEVMTEAGTAWACREDSSVNWFKRRGVRAAPPLLDPAFFLEAVPNSPARRSDWRDGIVGLVPRLEGYGLRAGPSRSRYVAAKASEVQYTNSSAFQVSVDIARRCIKAGSRIRLYIQTSADRPIVTAIYNTLESEFGASKVEMLQPATLVDYRESLDELSLVVAARFHACILAWGLGVPSLGWYDRGHGFKMPGLFSMLSSPTFCRETGVQDEKTIARDLFDQFDNATGSMLMTKKEIARLQAKTIGWFTHHLNEPSRRSDTGTTRFKLIHEITGHTQSALQSALADALETRKTLESIGRDVRELKARVAPVAENNTKADSNDG